MVIDFKVRNQAIYCDSHRFVAADSVGFLKARFAFDGDWTGYTITATFTNLDTKVSKRTLLDETYACEVPHEVLAGKGRLNVYAEGTRGGSVATTAMMKRPLPIKESGRREAGGSIPPTSDIYQQVMDKLNGFEEGEGLKGKIAEAVELYFMEHPPSGGGTGIQSVGIDEGGHLIVTLASGETIDAGILPKGEPGADGYTPSIEVETDTDVEYRLNIVNKDETITTPNLRNDSTPVGTIISYMGMTAPSGYLACDGAQHPMADYPVLAEHFKAQFGSANYFGGDGAETFAVPDLRGEFLRGTGTAARNTGTGSEVGAHQHPSEIPYTAVSGNFDSLIVYYDANQKNPDDYNIVMYADKTINTANLAGVTISKDAAFVPSHTVMRYTARPTNTSVLYCIKCR